MRLPLAVRAAPVLALLVSVTAPARADVKIYDSGDPENPKTLEAYGWVQPRFTWQQSDTRPGVNFDPNPAFTLQRFRLGFIANMAGWVRGQVEVEFAGQQPTPLIDAYAVASPIPEFAVTVGQFRVPFSGQNLRASKSFQLSDTAYFVTAKWVHDRDMGAMVSGNLLEGKARYFAGVFDGNDPGRAQTQNGDKYFLLAGRLELSPLGPPPRFEGDLRPLAERTKFVFNLGGGGMRNHIDDKHYIRTHVGADLGIWWQGASLYAEYYRRTDRSDGSQAQPPPDITSEGFNVQVGYFPPAPWTEEHLEIVGRFQRFDPFVETKHPGHDAGERDLDQSNPTWGYQGYAFGLNVFPTKVHDLKLQASYEIRNELKKCLANESGAGCTGFIRNNLFVAQATVAFLTQLFVIESRGPMKVTSLVVPSLLLAAGLTLIGVAACQNTDATAAPSGAGGASVSGTGANACAFTITPRPEYTDYAPGKPVNGPTPNIRRVRLGLGGTITAGAPTYADPARSFAVAWQTDDGTLASDVTWGSDPDPTKWDAKNRVSGSTWNTPPGSIQGNGPQRMHEAYVCGLSPATTYYYRVGGGPAGAEVWSDVFPFTTTPAAGDATVKIAITGDSRGEEQNAWQLLQGRVKGQGVTLQLFSGDMINLGPDQGEWEQWLDRAEKDEKGAPSSLPSILTLAAHGNHDNHTTLFYGNVTLPQDPAYAAGSELFFSVDVGPVHVVVFDDFYVTTNQNPDFISSLSDWLEKDLTAAEANRANVPWIIAVHHHPEYSSSLHGKDSGVIAVRNFTNPIWNKHRLDLSIAGHDHNYERSKPLSGTPAAPTIETDTKAGTTYLVCAGSGADAYSAGMSTFTDVSHDYKSGGIGLYSILTATKSTLTIEAHAMTAAGDDPIFDTYTLKR